ncbi:MAG: hypothetical protein HZB61_06140 [Nitrospirae bacterium]|nr:hypothetical protein [Nitrospirota bacterium]
MTTVINLNFLNFFKLKLDNYTINDIRTHNQYFDNRRQNYPTEQEATVDIIDITSYNHLMAVGGKGPSLQSLDIRKHVNFITPFEANKTYDREGRSVQYSQDKGMRVNSFA